VTFPEINNPVEYAQGHGNAWLAEMAALRRIALPPLGSGPEEYRAALIEARGKLDRVEEILGQTLRMRGGMQRRAVQCEQAAEDRWNQLADEARRTGHTSRDYEGAKERYASFTVRCMDEIRMARQWRLAADLAADLVERARTTHFGLKDVRGELIEHLRAFVLESNLDR
jgi:hypothetical protein